MTGLLILKNGAVVAEHYRYGRRAQDRFLSFSVAKSITSPLIGIAAEQHLIASLDDPAGNYVAALQGPGHGRATVRQLLRMSSGVKFVADYSGHADIAPRLRVLAALNERAFPAGEKLGYASSEAAVLGYVLAAAAHTNSAALTSAWLWRPLGAETGAARIIGNDGQLGGHTD